MKTKINQFHFTLLTSIWLGGFIRDVGGIRWQAGYLSVK